MRIDLEDSFHNLDPRFDYLDSLKRLNIFNPGNIFVFISMWT